MRENKKSVLNQFMGKQKPKVSTVVPEDIVPEEGVINLGENQVIDALTETKKTKQAEISLKESGELIANTVEKSKANVIEIEEEIDDEVVFKSNSPLNINFVPKKEVEKLSHKDLRWLQRNGKMPK